MCRYYLSTWWQTIANIYMDLEVHSRFTLHIFKNFDIWHVWCDLLLSSLHIPGFAFVDISSKNVKGHEFIFQALAHNVWGAELLKILRRPPEGVAESGVNASGVATECQLSGTSSSSVFSTTPLFWLNTSFMRQRKLAFWKWGVYIRAGVVCGLLIIPINYLTL